MFFKKKGQFGETNRERLFCISLEGSFQDSSQFIFPGELDGSSDLIRDVVNNKTFLP